MSWHVRWATSIEQGNNRRTNRLVLYQGKQVTIKSLSRITGIPASTIAMRIERGWPDWRLADPIRAEFRRRDRLAAPEAVSA